ncbi:MAG: response regulator [Terriglobales bacterium]
MVVAACRDYSNLQCHHREFNISLLPKILLIDDSKFLRRANELSLAKAGHQILAASDGEEGLRLARDKQPDVIILDMMLPKLGGAQLLQLLKSDSLTAAIPVIVLSSLAQKNESKLIAAGAAAYFEKSDLGLEQCSGELSRTITKILSSPHTSV